MTPEALVSDLRARGVSLVADGDKLRCRPRSALSDQELEALKASKPAVLALLRGEALPRPERPLVCICCRERRFWRSVYGVVVCSRCHPPAKPTLVAEWTDAHAD